jgi:hypothetical protein
MSFDKAFTRICKTIRKMDGVTVTYRRGESSFELIAARGNTTYNASDANGALVEIDNRDYLIAAADLEIDGQPIEPQHGDMIEETLRGKLVRFEVIPDRGRCWRFSDPSQSEYRIHTQCVAEFDSDLFTSIGGVAWAMQLGGALEPVALGS